MKACKKFNLLTKLSSALKDNMLNKIYLLANQEDLITIY